MTTNYRVTKLHTAGLLVGMTTTETTSVRFVAGERIRRSFGRGAYVVLSVVAL